jgi:hypothetical protein
MEVSFLPREQTKRRLKVNEASLDLGNIHDIFLIEP